MMKYLIKIIGFTTAICSLSIATSQAQNKLHLETGKQYEVVSNAQIHTATTYMGQDMDQNMEAISTFEITVVSNKNNNYQLISKMTAVKNKLEAMGQEQNFDSSKPEDMKSQQGELYKDILNHKVPIEISKNGEVLKTDTKNIKTPVNKSIIQEFAKSGFGIQSTFLALPSQLNVGKTWKAQNDQDGAKSDLTYRIKEIQGDQATVAITGTMNVDKTVEQMGIKAHSKLKGTVKGETRVNIKTGVVLTQTLDNKVEGTTEVQGMEMPIKTDTKVTTHVSEL